ncbi:35057_t:CDS:2 [Gigaspora margarita]|uniref:35057_t:CDS:1 n=1 Tax=Gigaspora margarita TaxID=4874 RepID=A0ABN7UGW7_GIGMA|nr:35057_t:CDS:2 [Gigaspora margarita]
MAQTKNTNEWENMTSNCEFILDDEKVCSISYNDEVICFCNSQITNLFMN